MLKVWRAFEGLLLLHWGFEGLLTGGGQLCLYAQPQSRPPMPCSAGPAGELGAGTYEGTYEGEEQTTALSWRAATTEATHASCSAGPGGWGAGNQQKIQEGVTVKGVTDTQPGWRPSMPCSAGLVKRCAGTWQKRESSRLREQTKQTGLKDYTLP
eukprot:1142382-Pelagomonas_calceolata.AAC.10